jgi:hypothetical protein
MHLDTTMQLAQIRTDEVRRSVTHHHTPSTRRIRTRSRWTRRSS